jgi:hypothetical protein
MENKILIEARMSYGRVLYYPACELSRVLTNISGKKTLSVSEIKKLVAVGFEIKYKNGHEAEEIK